MSNLSDTPNTISCAAKPDLTLAMLNACPQDDRHEYIAEADEWLRCNRRSIGMYDRADVVAAWVDGEALA